MEETFKPKEIIEKKSEYEGVAPFSSFINKYSSKCGAEEYRDFTESSIDTYIDDFGKHLESKIKRHGNVAITCKTEKENGKDVSYCSVHPPNIPPKFKLDRVPKNLYKDFVFLAITRLTDDDARKIKYVKLHL